MSARFLRTLLRIVALLSALLPAVTTLLGQSIVTVAGGGTLDGQQATALNLHGPLGLAFDRDGTLLIIEERGNAIRRVNFSTGVMTTVTGNGGAGFAGDGGPAVFATIDGPRFLTVDSDGNIYFADNLNNRVRRIDVSSGIITTVAGGGSPPQGSIGDGGPATGALVRRPSGVAIFGGALYFSESAYNSQRIRKVLLSDMTISTIAGGDTPGSGGDNGPAVNATLNVPTSITFDRSGNLYVAETEGERIREIDTSGKITTVAGGGTPADGRGDGLPATQAKLAHPTDLAIDANGDLNIALESGVRRVNHLSQVITTLFEGQEFPYGIAIDRSGNIYESSGAGRVVKASPPAYEPVIIAGGGTFTGDGRPATSAVLQGTEGVATDAAENIYIADTDNLSVRKVDAATGIISTVAGDGRTAYASSLQEGAPAVGAVVGYPADVAVDPAGGFFLVSDPLNGRVWKVETAGGTISTLAGGGNPADGIGDNGAATAASMTPQGVSIEPSGTILIADNQNNRIRRVDANGIIRTIAGSGPANGSGGLAGDNGPATQALLKSPLKAVTDTRGNIFISDSGNGLIRKVDPSGTITTYGGTGVGESLTDDVVATATSMGPAKIALDAAGNLFLADSAFHRVRRIDALTTIITTVAGSSTHYTQPGFEGDGGPAKNAKLSINYGVGAVTVGPGGDLFIADANNNRIRAVYACTAPTGTLVTVPASGAVDVPTAPTLSWSGVKRAFRYDLYLDTVSPPVRLLASDLSATSFTAANLQSSTTYFWRVISKGDPFCPSPTQLVSPVASFTTGGACGAPASFVLSAPADGATVSSPVRLDWQAATGAGSYDVYAGPGSAPPLVVSGLTTNSFTLPSLPSGSYSWIVVAHAICEPTKTVRSASRSFTVAGACSAPGSVAIASPPAGSEVSPSLSLTWTAAANASSYDIYLGTGTQPPLFAAAVFGTTLAVSGLNPGATYFWRVVARVTCNGNLTSSTGTFSFVVRGTCTAPGASTIVFAPPGDVAAGQTYAISWSDAPGLDPAGGYLVERSSDSAFSSIDSSQVTTSSAASFVARSAGTFYHRVRPIPGCDPQLAGPWSEARTVHVVNAAPNVVFTLLPEAVLSSLGDRLEQLKTSFALENLGDSPVQIFLGRSEINSVPFFTIVDPAGGGALVTLLPRSPKQFEVHFSGPPNDRAGSYQGVIFAASTGGGLTVTPYAFVNLKVGGAIGSTPRFLSGGIPIEYIAFPGFDGTDDSARPPISVDIRNDGTSSLEVAGEIGPEVWLRPEAGWNTDPIAAGGTRTVRLFTQRSFAPNGSVLPRYTWFTLRTRDGATARLLVEDNPASTSVSGRRFALDAGDPSIILPEVTSRSIAAGSLVSRLRFTNSGSDAVQADLVFTPEGADGFAATSVRTSSIVIPPNDAVTLTDPLQQIFGLSRPQTGSMEVRAAREKIGFLSVSAESVVNVEKGGTGGYQVRPFGRGEGARSGLPQTIPGISTGAGVVTRILLAETGGADAAAVKLRLSDPSGVLRGQVALSVPRYGLVEVTDAGAAFGVPLITGARIEVSVDSGGGSVASLALATDPASGNAAVFAGQGEPNPAAGLLRRLAGIAATSIQTYIIPDVVNGPLSPSQTFSYQTLVGLRAPATTPATFSLTYISSTFGGSVPILNISLAAGESREISNILRDGFGLPSGARGSLQVDGPPGISVYAAILGGDGIPAVRGSLPVIPSFSQILTGGAFASQRPLYLDGLEQSVDPQRGTHWIIVLNEVSGRSGTITVGLYEAGNRTRPIGEKELQIGPHQQITLDSVFSALDLDSPSRKKDRANVLCLVQGKNGSATVSSVGISIDPRTGKSEARQFEPAGTASPVSISTAAPIVTPPPTPRKRRAVRR